MDILTAILLTELKQEKAPSGCPIFSGFLEDEVPVRAQNRCPNFHNFIDDELRDQKHEKAPSGCPIFCSGSDDLVNFPAISEERIEDEDVSSNFNSRRSTLDGEDGSIISSNNFNNSQFSHFNSRGCGLSGLQFCVSLEHIKNAGFARPGTVQSSYARGRSSAAPEMSQLSMNAHTRLLDICNLRGGNKRQVACNSCESHAHEDGTAPLTMCLQPRHYRHVRNMSVQNPMYVNVAASTLNNVEINIRNDAGNIIGFPKGAITVLTLHFKKFLHHSQV